MRIISFERQKKQPLVYWSDRLNRAGYLVKRRDAVTTEDGFKTRVVVWFTKLDEDKLRTLTSIDITEGQVTSSTLVNTTFGLCCPKCRTNEFIHNQVDFHLKSIRDQARFNLDEFGYYCRKCGTLS